MVLLDDFVPNPFGFRVVYNEDAVYELAGSFYKYGILGFNQPCNWIGMKNN